MTVAARTSEKSLNIYQSTRRYNPKDRHHRTHLRENLRSYHLITVTTLQLSFTKFVKISTYFQHRSFVLTVIRHIYAYSTAFCAATSHCKPLWNCKMRVFVHSLHIAGMSVTEAICGKRIVREDFSVSCSWRGADFQPSLVFRKYCVPASVVWSDSWLGFFIASFSLSRQIQGQLPYFNISRCQSLFPSPSACSSSCSQFSLLHSRS
jgi:hypothetical protein